jgi:hypothetical protein
VLAPPLLPLLPLLEAVQSSAGTHACVLVPSKVVVLVHELPSAQEPPLHGAAQKVSPPSCTHCSPLAQSDGAVHGVHELPAGAFPSSPPPSAWKV